MTRHRKIIDVTPGAESQQQDPSPWKRNRILLVVLGILCIPIILKLLSFLSLLIIAVISFLFAPVIGFLLMFSLGAFLMLLASGLLLGMKLCAALFKK